MRTKTYGRAEYEKIITQSVEQQVLKLIQEDGYESAMAGLEQHLLAGKLLSSYKSPHFLVKNKI